MSTIVAGIFRESTSVQDALARLERDGLTRDRISVLGSPETNGKKLVVVERTKAPEGAVAGGVIGGVIGVLVGLVLAFVTLPDAGELAVAPWLLALAGLGAGAAVGGLVGALAGRARPEHEARLLDESLAKNGTKGGILVGVETEDGEQARRVAGNLEAAGASTVTSH